MDEKSNEQKALEEAIKALYFDDSNDFGAALWKIVELLGGKTAVNLLIEDEETAYQMYVKP